MSINPESTPETEPTPGFYENDRLVAEISDVKFWKESVAQFGTTTATLVPMVTFTLKADYPVGMSMGAPKVHKLVLDDGKIQSLSIKSGTPLPGNQTRIHAFAG